VTSDRLFSGSLDIYDKSGTEIIRKDFTDEIFLNVKIIRGAGSRISVVLHSGGTVMKKKFLT
jgi:hypothetical protein